MHTVYVACLVGGAVATALFALLGVVGGMASHGGHLHVSHGHAGHGHAGVAHSATAGHHTGTPDAAQQVAGWLAASGGWALSWFSPLTLAAAALCFGGIGLIGGSGVVALLFAVIAAVLGAALIRSLLGALVRASTPPLQLTAEGALATVNATIRPDAPGEVIYTLEGLHRSLPARSTDGMVIPRGTAVVITRREGGFAWVEPLDPLAEMETAERSNG